MRPCGHAPETTTAANTILTATLTPPPKRLGVTHWSSRLLADELKVAQNTVLRTWAALPGAALAESETFKFSTDPELEAKVPDIVGLYLDPPEKAVVLCIDEKTQVQALDRTQPLLPMQPDLPEKRTHDYVRHGTTTLFAALEVGTGKVTADLPSHPAPLGRVPGVPQAGREGLPRVASCTWCWTTTPPTSTPEVMAWLDAEPPRAPAFHPASGSPGSTMVSVNRPWTSGLARAT